MKKDKSEIWENLGRRSFARFYKLSMEEVEQMERSPNGVFHEMVEEMAFSLREYENYLVRIKDQGEIKKVVSRLDLLDI